MNRTRPAARLLAIALLAVALCAAGAARGHAFAGSPPTPSPLSATSAQASGDAAGCRLTRASVRVRFSRRRWPHIADHIADVRRRYPLVLHIDRAGADENREQSLRGIPTRRGFDRDEYPPAVAREGGAGADVRHVRSRENRSAGSYLGNRLEAYCSGQRFRMLAAP